MGSTWQGNDRRVRTMVRASWGAGVATVVVATMAGLTWCRPPAPPNIGTARHVVIVAEEDDCPIGTVAVDPLADGRVACTIDI